MQIWKQVVGFEGLYEVSSDGLVRTVERFYYSGKPLKKQLLPAKVMKLKKSKDGYFQVGLRINGKRFFKRVHRLVCIAFLDNPENKPQVNHVINYFLLLFGCQCFFFFIGLFLLQNQHCNSPFLMRQSQFIHLPGSLWIFLLINIAAVWLIIDTDFD